MKIETLNLANDINSSIKRTMYDLDLLSFTKSDYHYLTIGESVSISIPKNIVDNVINIIKDEKQKKLDILNSLFNEL